MSVPSPASFELKARACSHTHGSICPFDTSAGQRARQLVLVWVHLTSLNFTLTQGHCLSTLRPWLFLPVLHRMPRMQ